MKLWIAAALLLAALAGLTAFASSQDGCTWYVLSEDDDGEGTLRRAVELANRDNRGGVICFTQAMTIRLLSPLPTLSAPDTTVDASMGGITSTDIPPTVWLDGTHAGDAAGLEFEAANAVVRGLGIVGFQRYGIGIVTAAAGGAVIENNWIGLRADGAAAPNRTGGIAIIAGPVGARIANNRIAGNSVPQRTGHGIVVGGGGSSETEIIGNIIGIGPNGEMLPNDDGILVVDRAHAIIRRNTIGNSRVAGIELRETRREIPINDNRIGLRQDDALAPNDVGIFLGPGSAMARIGTTAPNEIAGNRVGIAVEQGAREAIIMNNWIGLASPDGVRPSMGNPPASTLVRPNRERGISIIADAAEIQAAGNYIAAGDYGIVVDGETTSTISLTRNVVAGARDGPTEVAIDIRGGIEINLGGERHLGNEVCGADYGIRLAETEGVTVRHNLVGSGAATKITFDSDDSMLWGIRLDDGVTRARIWQNTIADAGMAAISVIGDHSQENQLENNQFLNNGIDIDLGADGPDANDPHDADEGPNERLNHPQIVDHEIERTGDNSFRSIFSGTATPGSRVEIYVLAHNGEREMARSSFRADADGNWEARTSELPQGPLRALASLPAGATSEFSPSFLPAQLVELQDGVNWFGWSGAEMSVEDALADLTQPLKSIRVWSPEPGSDEGGRWLLWAPRVVIPPFARLESLRRGDVVRLELEDITNPGYREIVIPPGGAPPTANTLELSQGLNSVTWLGGPTDALETLADLSRQNSGLIGTVWQWGSESQSWQAIWPRLEGAWDPGRWETPPALWIRAASNGTLYLD